MVQRSDGLRNYTDSASYTLEPEENQEKFNLNLCPNSLTSVLVFMIAVLIAILLYGIGLVTDDILAYIGAIGCLILSISFAQCSLIIGSLFIISSIILLIKVPDN